MVLENLRGRAAGAALAEAARSERGTLEDLIARAKRGLEDKVTDPKTSWAQARDAVPALADLEEGEALWEKHVNNLKRRARDEDDEEDYGSSKKKKKKKKEDDDFEDLEEEDDRREKKKKKKRDYDEDDDDDERAAKKRKRKTDDYVELDDDDDYDEKKRKKEEVRGRGGRGASEEIEE